MSFIGHSKAMRLDRVDQLFPIGINGAAHIQCKKDLSGNYIDGIGMHLYPAYGCHRISIAPRHGFQTGRHFHKACQRIFSQSHGDGAGMSRNTFQGNAASGCAIDRGDNTQW